MQGRLHITEKEYCLFCVWTGPEFELKVEKIVRDDDFYMSAMRPKLLQFYNDHLIPEIVDPKKCRSLPIRNT